MAFRRLLAADNRHGLVQLGPFVLPILAHARQLADRCAWRHQVNDLQTEAGTSSILRGQPDQRRLDDHPVRSERCNQ